MTDAPHQQPYLHDLLACVRAPALVLTGRDGQLRDGGVQGGYLADRRILSRSVLQVAGAEPAPISGELDGAGASRSVSVARGLGDPGADPTVTVERRRAAAADGVAESITVRSAAREPVRARLTLELGCDLAGMAAVKAGLPPAELVPAERPDGLRWTGPDGTEVTAVATPAPAEVSTAPARLGWDVDLGPGDSVTVELSYSATGPAAPVVLAPVGPSRLAVPAVRADDPRLAGFLARSVADLAALELADPQEPRDHFLAAGAPWYLTLFGRDCLLAARMLLPLGTELAGGTLRTLARRQGSRVDPESAEEPGKILHEIRAVETEHHEGHQLGRPLRLPATYYGTVDATPLWILLLHDSWRWGLPGLEVEELLPNLERALAWLADYGTDGNGFLSYVDRSGHGLSNQGWKDSADSVSFADGRLADPPVALSEVQAYGYAAAMAGAALLEAFGRPGAERWRAWAAKLAERFRQRFWLADQRGGYPALALDGHGEPVDSVASNMGHLLGTGLLSAAEEGLVAARLDSPELSAGFGLRTLASSAARFNPLSYHNGSVWAHDTAIAVTGLAAAGSAGPATVLIEGLLAAAAGFDYRMPELHGGHRAEPGRRPLPYPASCRPQAWSAASAMAIVSALLGPRPDAPAGSLEFRPLLGPAGRPPLGELSVTGLRFAGRPLSVRLAADGSVTSTLG
ncbi:glycogen debranching N-terminal domain-containing protein [Jatrophihabitans sp.]|uniref:amylo-alpha-1,6-glucosidase n=1 Tax=Jatrophihabitans sp. TaxID=1932789 RepID=UPI002C2E3384|nr:glycogen debranching N-terminal domain-containing protein [Jatrophihabitans sp.]